MDPDAIKVAFFAWNIAAPVFTLVNFSSWNAIIVANGNWLAIDHINRVLVQFLPGFAKPQEQGQEQLGDVMQAAVEAALA